MRNFLAPASDAPKTRQSSARVRQSPCRDRIGKRRIASLDRNETHEVGAPTKALRSRVRTTVNPRSVISGCGSSAPRWESIPGDELLENLSWPQKRKSHRGICSYTLRATLR